MTDKTKKYLNLAKDYVMITLGLFTYAFGFTAFILPEKIVIGSVTGLSSLIHFWLGWNVALTYYVINIILLCIAFRSVGKQFVLRTIIGASIATFFIGVLEPMFPEPIVQQQTFMNVIRPGTGRSVHPRRQHGRHRHYRGHGCQAQHGFLWTHDDVL